MTDTPLCGALWPDSRIDNKPITCHLDKGHGGFWHRWDHENHVTEGEDFGHGMIAWHTEMGKALTAGAQPTIVQFAHPIDGVTHTVIPHPKTVVIRHHLPSKPNRRTAQ